MNLNKYEEIRELLEGLSKEEFNSMVTKANEHLNLEDAHTFELASEYNTKSSWKYENEFSVDLSKKNDISKAA